MGSAVMPPAGGAAAAPKATLARLDGPAPAPPEEPPAGTLEAVEVGWNPASYRLQSRARFAGEEDLEAPPGALRARSERFSTELFVDTTDRTGGARDARAVALRLKRWMEPLAESLLPPRVLFLWGPLRFAGLIERLEEEWILFDPDGTPVRGRLQLELRGLP